MEPFSESRSGTRTLLDGPAAVVGAGNSGGGYATPASAGVPRQGRFPKGEGTRNLAGRWAVPDSAGPRQGFGGPEKGVVLAPGPGVLPRGPSPPRGPSQNACRAACSSF